MNSQPARRSSSAFHSLSLLFVLLSALLVAGCSEPQPEVLTLSGPTMGTQYHISWINPEQDVTPADALRDMVNSRLKQLNAVFSTYDPESELSILNKKSAQLTGRWIPVSPELMSVLKDAAFVNGFSLGRFDVTVGPLVNLWGFGPQPHDTVPTEEDIKALLPSVGMQHLQLRPDSNEILQDEPLYIDLSAVAKGWAVDDIGLLLENLGISNYLVEIGGEVRVRGRKPNGPWRLAIERPVYEAGVSAQKIIEPGDRAVATSGDYRNYFEKDGQRYSHTIDPVTGYPINHKLASVTVIMPTCSLADAWATAINVAGPELGMNIAEANHLPVFMLIRDGDGYKEAMSSAFIEMFGNSADTLKESEEN